MSTTHPSSFKPLKTVRLGQYSSADQYLEALKRVGCGLNRWATAMVCELAIPQYASPLELDLVAVLVESLGIKPSGYYRDVCDCAIASGLERCPPDTALALGLAGFDSDGLHRIGSEPLTCRLGEDSHFTIFNVAGKVFLAGGAMRAHDVYVSSEHFIFVRPRTS